MFNWYWRMTETVDITETVDMSETVNMSAASEGYIPIISDIIGLGYKQAVDYIMAAQTFPAEYAITPQVFSMTVR